MKKGTIGQWGSRLYVSTQEAEDVCKEIWGVPAELASIDFMDSTEEKNINDCLQVTCAPIPSESSDIKISVEGWKNTRVLSKEDFEYADTSPKRWGGLPVYWTPTIKALWAPFFLSKEERNLESDLPLHKLRLSASAIRLHWSGLKENPNVGLELGLGLIVDNVLIEIGTKFEEGL